MNQFSNLSQKSTRRSALTVAVLSACLVGGGLAVAQTKQLKEPAQPTPDATAAQVGETNDANAPQNFNRSYSVVVENRTDKDGKTVQSKKVWKDGQLVQSEEKTIDGTDADATIGLPNGQVVPGQLVPGDPQPVDPNALNSGAPTNIFPGFGGATNSPFEMMRQMEAQIREQQAQMQGQIEEMRRQFSANPNGPFVFPNGVAVAPSKYWIGAAVEPTPEIVAAQLPIEPNQGMLIQTVVPDSPTAKAGLQRFDVVVKIDGKEIADASEIGKIVDEIGAKTVQVEYYRKGRLAEAELTIAERPQTFPVPSGVSAPFDSSADKKFRVVRPGLIVPAPENATETTPEIVENETVETETTTENAVPTPATDDNAASEPETETETETEETTETETTPEK